MTSIKFKKKHLIVAMLIFIISFTISFFAKEYIANIFVGYTMNELDLPKINDRVLIFAPHSDDEAIGAANLIKKSIQNGAKVKVVIATNGDGFVRAVAMESININPKPADYIRYGYNRQMESLKALESLGVKSENVIFLGYPDGGISKMWRTNWMNSKPYISSYTKTNKSPYNNSYNSNAIYSGVNLYKDIVKIVEDFKPTHVVYPHSNDKHPDHWGLNAFVKYSMKCINYKPEHEWLYLVHRGNWPTPLRRNRSIFLVPPMSIYNTGTSWLSVSMTNKDIEDKAKLFRQYKSQKKRIGFLMAAFERKNELFGEYDNAALAKNLNHDSEIKLNRDNSIIIDPHHDSLKLEVDTASDIRELHAELSKESNLHVFVLLSKKADQITSYYLNMIFIKDGRASPLNLVIKGKAIRALKQRESSIENIDGIQLEVKKQILHITIPKDRIGSFSSFFMNAESSFNSFYMDRTAWRMVDVENEQ